MNFITDLFDSSKYNAILMIICRLSKKRHYISCIIDDEDITVEKTAEMLIQWVNWTYDLSSFIVSDRDSQFIFILWKFLYKRLSISLQLFIVYHSQINDQSERVNQNVKRYLWFFCLYMQNDWFKWLFMIKFVNNNILSSVIFLILFFMNKNFHSHMSFNSDIIEYKSTRERLQVLRAYQGWIGLVSASSSDLVQPLFSFINISLFNIIFLSTSHSTRVTNTSSSSLAQPLNIT